MHNTILVANINEGVEKNRMAVEEKQLSKKEQKLLRRQQRDKEQEREKKTKKIKKLVRAGIIGVIIAGGILGLFWYLASKPPTLKSDIIATGGIHWHPEIKISIFGETQEIPANIGIGVTHKPIHTHDDMGVVHLEFSGLVKKDDVRLGQFFEIWGKQFNKDCIFSKCNGPEGQVKMFVNGKENSEFENYVMKDGDKIEIIFE